MEENIHANFRSGDYAMLRGQYIKVKNYRLRYGIMDLPQFDKKVFIVVVYPNKKSSAVKYEFDYRHFCDVFDLKELSFSMLELIISKNYKNLPVALGRDGNISIKRNVQNTTLQILGTTLKIVNEKTYVKRPPDTSRRVSCDD